MAIVNDFRRINLSYEKDKKPPFLAELDKYEGFEIYSSNFDHKIYIIYNPHDEKYYPFEDQGSDDIINDLIKNIQTYFE
jgi:hypothetical protein